MSTLSKKNFINRKANSLVFNALVSNSNIPKVCQFDDRIWVTNGYVAFSYSRTDFIFNADLFSKFDGLQSVVENAFDTAKIPCSADSFKQERTRNRIQVKLTADGCEPTYVNKEYLDMFSNDCSFLMSASPIQPVLVMSPYGEPCGIILPIRVGKNAW